MAIGNQNEFRMDLNQVMVGEHDVWRKRYIDNAKLRAKELIDAHFHPGIKIGGNYQRQPGPGTQQIEDFIVGRFIDDEGMNRYMEKFFNENFDRILEECMTAAIQHQCNRFAFQKANEKKSDFPANRIVSEDHQKNAI